MSPLVVSTNLVEPHTSQSRLLLHTHSLLEVCLAFVEFFLLLVADLLADQIRVSQASHEERLVAILVARDLPLLIPGSKTCRNQ